MNYLVMEIQANADGTVSSPVWAYPDDPDGAESKYHSVLTAAAISRVYKHSAVMFNDDGNYMKSEMYRHEEVIDKLFGNGESTSFPLTAIPKPGRIFSVTINSQATTDYTISGNTIQFGTAPANGATIIVDYEKKM